MKAVCKFCSSTSIYREWTATVEGWCNVDVEVGPDGAMDFTEDSFETDDLPEPDDAGDFVCSDCGHRARRLDDLVEAESPAGSTGCCCGHDAGDHPPRRFDPRVHTRGARPCTVAACPCREYEHDPAFATFTIRS